MPADATALSRIILYVKNIPGVAAFYRDFFGFRPVREERGWLELESPAGGCRIALHQAARTQKSGAAIKLVFAAADVPAFVERAAARGLKFGAIHTVAGSHQFANAKGPAGNSISISSRGLN